jgi:hypothetical protein
LVSAFKLVAHFFLSSSHTSTSTYTSQTLQHDPHSLQVLLAWEGVLDKVSGEILGEEEETKSRKRLIDGPAMYTDIK